MELAWPRLAEEETAIAIVVDNTRKKVATTNAIDRERCMTRPPEGLIELFNSGGRKGFSTVQGILTRFMVNCGRRVTVPNEEGMRAGPERHRSPLNYRLHALERRHPDRRQIRPR